MDTTTLLKAAAVWLGILVLATANGVLREAVLLPRLGQRAALVASGLLLSACILGVALASAPWMGADDAAASWRIGVFWLATTVAFELALGRLQRKSWSELARAYTFDGGNLWPLVLVVTLVAPWLAARVRGLA
ncbi:MAG TPA: hypothetical protein VFX05_14540 [Casimicrobiaceae bacterium]|jgi:hypothetical protein|nr:hypothetical protein [Casimicrobiaceae bacterium]